MSGHQGRAREHLIASHVKPWRDSKNEERLDGENGLLLTPTVDHLFDKGFISFENNGELIISPVTDSVSLRRMGIDDHSPVNVGTFSEGQRRYLEFHRENVLRMSRGIVPAQIMIPEGAPSSRNVAGRRRSGGRSGRSRAKISEFVGGMGPHRTPDEQLAAAPTRLPPGCGGKWPRVGVAPCRLEVLSTPHKD